MSSNDLWRIALATLLCLACAAMLSSQTAAPARFTCPSTIAIAETPSVQPPWHAEAARSDHSFQRPSIYNGQPGGQEYDLAPDDEKNQGRQVHQTWDLSGYRSMNLFVRCRYNGTAATLVSNLATQLKTCSFSFRNVEGNQPVASPSFECH
jgi:hypothetical protein